MANTIKFGNAQWATKKDSILAYNDENANFKPLPFVTSRASTATRVNKAGLLETVASGIPRVDYLSNTSGAYLLEPSSTNLITQSEAFGNSYWTKSGATIQGDASTAGVEKVTNGNFSSDTDWTKGAGTTISGGSANFSSATGVSLYQSFLLSGNYLVTFNVTNYASGVLNVYVGGSQNVATQNVSANGNGNYTVLLDFNSGNGNIIFGSSDSFTGSIDNVSIKEVSGFSAPSASSPLGAFKLVEDTNNGVHELLSPFVSLSSGSNIACSFLVKSAGRTKLRLSESAWTSNFLLADLSLGEITFQNGVSAGIESLSSGWFRINLTQSNSNVSTKWKVNLLNDSGSTSYTGNGTSGVYLFGAQIEAKSYATSYIPTAGSAITRLSETASQTVPDGVINSSEGVLFAEMSALADDGNYRLISLSDGTTDNRLFIGFRQSTGYVYYYVIVGGAVQSNYDTTITALSDSKIALKYKENDFALWINGTEISTDVSGTTYIANSLSVLKFSNPNGAYDFYGKVKDLRVYNTALTDAELEKLTKI